MIRKRFRTINVTIANAASISGEINLGTEGVLQGIEIPASWTTANITFLVSTDDEEGGTYVDVYDSDGVEVRSIVGGSSRYIPINPNILAGARWMKIRSGTTGTAVNQSGAKVLNLRIEVRS